MKSIRLLDLKTTTPLRSQTVYHAVAHAMTRDTPDTIIFVTPSDPYICIGYHQDLEREVDMAYCQEQGLPILRREVGGGAVYLDSGQVFVQWIFHREHLPASLEERFNRYIQPIVAAYQSLGVPAVHRPLNDIHVSGKKIGGTGAAQIGASEVLVGSLMFHFDRAMMAKVLKVPSEKMRDKIVTSLEQYMTTLDEQLPEVPDRQVVQQRYLEHCSAALGADIFPGTWSDAEEEMAAEIDRRFLSDEWLYQKGGLRPASVKIHEDVRVAESAHKAGGGLIRVIARFHHQRIDDISLSGDFTLLPAVAVGAIEQAVRGLEYAGPLLSSRIQEVYTLLNITSPGVTPDDFAAAIRAAAGPEGEG
jgi:lipoate-protein ligase A